MSDVLTITPEAVLADVRQKRLEYINILREMKRRGEPSAAKTRTEGIFLGIIIAMKRLAIQHHNGELLDQLDEENYQFIGTVSDEQLFI